MGSVSHRHARTRNYLNRVFIGWAGGASRPPVHSSRDVFPESELIESNYDTVRSEVLGLLRERDLRTYGSVDPARAAEVSTDWKIYYLAFLGRFNADAAKRLPQTVALLACIPSLVNATVAVLEPGVELSPHKGPYAGILRYHLGIEVPAQQPPYLRIGGRDVVWREQESVVIDDCFMHEVVNPSSERRTLLMVDFRRPLPAPLDLMNRLALRSQQKAGSNMIAGANAG